MVNAFALLVICIQAMCFSVFAAEDSAEENQILWQIDIEGNNAVTADTIKDAIALTESSHFPLFGAKREFDPIMLQSDLKRIDHLYKRLGYYQARVENSETT